jgi:hypothetical protein
VVDKVLHHEAVKRLDDHRAGQFVVQGGSGVASGTGLEGASEVGDVELVRTSKDVVSQRNLDDLPAVTVGEWRSLAAHPDMSCRSTTAGRAAVALA